MKRRALISTVASGAFLSLAGCSGGNSQTTTTTTRLPDSDADGVPDREDDYPDEYLMAEQKRHIDTTISLAAGSFETFRLDAEDRPHTLKMDFIVEGDGRIDMFLIPRKEYTDYQSGNEFSYVSGLTSLNQAEDSGGGMLPSGRYLLIIDYTDRATVPKHPEVMVDLLVDFAEPSSEQDYENTTQA